MTIKSSFLFAPIYSFPAQKKLLSGLLSGLLLLVSPLCNQTLSERLHSRKTVTRKRFLPSGINSHMLLCVQLIVFKYLVGQPFYQVPWYWQWYIPRYSQGTNYLILWMVKMFYFWVPGLVIETRQGHF